MKKKILYIVNFTLDQFNSVRDILYNIMESPQMNDYDQVLLQKEVRYNQPYEIKFDFGYKTYKNIKVTNIKEIISYNRIPFLKKYIFSFRVHPSVLYVEFLAAKYPLI